MIQDWNAAFGELRSWLGRTDGRARLECSRLMREAVATHEERYLDMWWPYLSGVPHLTLGARSLDQLLILRDIAPPHARFHLDLRFQPPSERQWRELLVDPAMAAITHLDLTGCGIKARTLRSIMNSEHAGSIAHLEAGDNPLHEGLAALSSGALPNLESLSVWSCGLDHTDIAHLKKTSLKRLDLGSRSIRMQRPNELGWRGVVALSKLGLAATLERLDISCTGASNTDRFLELCASGPWASLTWLSAARNALGDVPGITREHFPKLAHLDLSSTWLKGKKLDALERRFEHDPAIEIVLQDIGRGTETPRRCKACEAPFVVSPAGRDALEPDDDSAYAPCGCCRYEPLPIATMRRSRCTSCQRVYLATRRIQQITERHGRDLLVDHHLMLAQAYDDLGNHNKRAYHTRLAAPPEGGELVPRRRAGPDAEDFVARVSILAWIHSHAHRAPAEFTEIFDATWGQELTTKYLPDDLAVEIWKALSESVTTSRRTRTWMLEWHGALAQNAMG